MTYSGSLAMNRQRYSGRNHNTAVFRPAVKRLGPVTNTVVLIVLMCLLGLLYLTQVTKTNAFGYAIDTLEQQQSALKTEHDNLEVASARLQSLDRVENSEAAKALVATTPTAVLE